MAPHRAQSGRQPGFDTGWDYREVGAVLHLELRRHRCEHESKGPKGGDLVSHGAGGWVHGHALVGVAEEERWLIH